LKKDCLDLPEKIHADMPVILSGESERLYGELKGKLIAHLSSGDVLTVPNKVALFTKFRQLTGGTLAGIGVIDASNAKLEALLGELSDSSEQAIIWSCFTEEINYIMVRLSRRFSACRFDGKTSQGDREAGISDFTAGRVRLLVANPMAASQGLNLQNAHIQYWYSLPTSAKTYEQAEGRTHRSGQKEVCLYKKIIASGTVDERVAQILESKTEIMLSFREGNVADIIDLV
jgi:SNF2 family DNA or RNA helicase